MTTPPIGNTTPLNVSPYYSRLTAFTLNATDTKNYPLIAFKPGFALQAAELNEIQENFAIQQTLSNTLLQNWMTIDPDTNNTGTETDNYYGPGWNGAIPLNPDQISVTGQGANAGQGWYLITLPLSKLKFWIYNDKTWPSNSLARSPGYYYGFTVTQEFIPCTNTQTGEGWRFNDQSSSGFLANTCGDNRFKIIIASAIAIPDPANNVNFLPITKAKTGLIQYMNNRFVANL